jgi:hypothetical protein
MPGLYASQVVQVWETAEGRDSIERGLVLLAAAHPDMTREQLSALTIGARDELLFHLRQDLFGGVLNAFAECPDCFERLEYSLSAADLLNRGPSHGPDPPADPLEIDADGFSLRLCLLNSADLAVASRCATPDDARSCLLRRSVTEVSRDGTVIALEEVPQPVIDSVAQALVAADPLADLTILLECPACRHFWEVVFDIGQYLWAEIRAMAQRLLREVHALALAYRWSERDILAMSATRRNFYLEIAT